MSLLRCEYWLLTWKFCSNYSVGLQYRVPCAPPSFGTTFLLLQRGVVVTLQRNILFQGAKTAGALRTPLFLIRFWKGNFFGDPCALFSLDTLCVLNHWRGYDNLHGQAPLLVFHWEQDVRMPSHRSLPHPHYYSCSLRNSSAHHFFSSSALAMCRWASPPSPSC